MASEQASNGPSSSPVDWSLGSAFSESEASFGKLEGDGQRIGVVLALTTREAVRLGIEFKNSQERAAQSAREWLTALNNIYTNLTNQLAALPKLTGLYQKLGQAMQSAKLPPGQAVPPDHGETAVGAANSLLGMVAKPMGDSANYQSIVNDLVIKAGASPGAVKAGDPQAERLNGKTREEQREKTTNIINRKVVDISRQTGMGGTEAADLIRQLVDSGISLEQSLDLAPLAAQFSVGQGVDAKDTAAMFRSLVDGKVGSSEMPTILNQIIGDARADGAKVGIGDVAQMMPRLMAAMIAQERSGSVAVRQVSQMVQARGKDLGSSIQVSSDVERSIEKRDIPEVAPETKGANYLEGDLAVRREGSEQRQKEMGAAFTRLSTSIGDALRPVTDTVVILLGAFANGLAALVDVSRPVVTVLGGLALTGAAAVSALGLIRTGKALVETGKVLFAKEQGPDAKNDWMSRARRVAGRVMNEPQGDSSTQPLRQRDNRPVRVVVINTRDFGGGGGGNSNRRRDKPNTPKRDAGSPGRNARNAGSSEGRKVQSTDQKSASNEKKGGQESSKGEQGRSGQNAGNQRSFDTHRGAAVEQVHNPSPVATGASSGNAQSFQAQRGGYHGAGNVQSFSGFGPGNGVQSGLSGSSFQSGFSGASMAGGSTSGGGFKSITNAFAKAASFAKAVPASRYAAAGLQAIETFRRPGTFEEKAEGYGTAAGNLGGSMVGGAIGAAIGSVLIPIPGVGTAIGAMVGSSLGGSMGEDLGGKFARFLFGRSDKSVDQAPVASASKSDPVNISTEVVASPSVVASRAEKTVASDADNSQGGDARTVPAPISASVASSVFMSASGYTSPTTAAAAPVTQNFTISPSIPITVQGTIADPVDLVRQLTPEIQRLFADLAAQANRSNQMWDTPATTYVA